MKLEKLEHKHTLTSILKVSIFALFLLLPFIAILPSTLYFAFNEHAKEYTQQTITETYKYETNEVNSNDDLIEGNVYLVEDIFPLAQQYFLIATTDNLDITIVKNETTSLNLNTYFKIDDYGEEIDNNYSKFTFSDGYFGYTTLVNNYYTTYVNNTVDYNDDFFLDYGSIYVRIDYLKIGSISNLHEYFIDSDYLGEKTTTLTENELNPNNAFNYAFNNLENQNWFSWTKNTPLYTGLSTMTNNLGINNNVIPMILSYWLILTTIYIILDIIINLYTFITHILTGKKAN